MAFVSPAAPDVKVHHCTSIKYNFTGISVNLDRHVIDLSVIHWPKRIISCNKYGEKITLLKIVWQL